MLRRFLILIILVVATVLVSDFRATLAQEAPFSGSEQTEELSRQAANECGLIETNAADPDWILATSDRILRANLCVASSPCSPNAWYDRPFNPCYPDNRFWKLEEDSGTAFAYPLAALGVGSFDGLYVRRNVGLQFFQGTGDDVPFGPELTGPKYVSITYWRDVFPACDGFEPGTFFVEGGPGALGNHSLKIGGDSEVLELDDKEDDNEREHHTDKYEDRYVVRRADSFTVEVKLSKEFGSGCHEVYFEARHEFDGSETVIEIPEFDGPVPEAEWGAERVDVTTNGDRTRTVEMKVNVPVSAPIGEYAFKVLVRNRGETDATDEEDFPSEVVVLFNPWSANDSVHLASAAARDEYVMNENGSMWRGDKDSNRPKAWRYSQFDKETLTAALMLLDGQDASARADAKLTSRHYSKLVNSNDDGGVIVGNWSGSYGGGSAPGTWSGSDQILRQYVSGGSSVSYGQCWVFGGVLSSLLRTVGIPARPLSNFQSAHDTDMPVDKAVDFYFDASGNFDRGRTSDSIWNYHVWCDAWVAQWHAVDATPQERSGGFFQLGPAPHSAIKADSGGLYDVDFVVAEVDADVKYWRPDAGGTDQLIRTDGKRVGHNITTKATGGSGPSDITAAYKTPEAAPVTAGQPVIQLASKATTPEIDVAFNVPAEVPAGTDIRWEIVLTNSSLVPCPVHAVISASAVSYDGTLIASLGGTDVTEELPASGVLTVPFEVSVATYADWTGVTSVFEGAFSIDVPGSDFLTAEIDRTIVQFPSPTLTITPSGPLAVGATGSIGVEWTNPLAVDIADVVVSFAVGGGLSLGGSSDLTVDLGTVGAGANLQLTELFSGESEGIHGITVNLVGDKLSDLFADGSVTVFSDCNGNGTPDDEDIDLGVSPDCNGNAIPDECEADCDGSGVPDDCDVEDDPSLDCNANGLPDSCDLDSGSSADDNDNGTPDECDVDCNENGVPDDLDISRGTSSDFNGNGVPDECDVDCNSNGIADEIEIAQGTAEDENQNGVPDECEVTNRPPSADAGADQVVECSSAAGAVVTLDGSGSSDPDGDPLTFRWEDAAGLLLGTSPSVEITVPLGTFTFTLTVEDGKGGADSDSVGVTVGDTAPPVIAAATAEPAVLWPPNHKMVPVSLSFDVTDACDAEPMCQVTTVTSSEPVTGPGDRTEPDWLITGPMSVELRAERAGGGDGRLYSIEVECTDASGNAASGDASVAVPHDQGG
ncbi:MAG: hypothetical protein GY719_18770 [bacterium]|nr:hypothetical protein [bacterium]